MKAPKKRQSDDRNSHIASLALVTPGVRCRSCRCRGRRPSASSDGVPAASSTVDRRWSRRGSARWLPSRRLLGPGLDAPRVHAEQDSSRPGIRATRSRGTPRRSRGTAGRARGPAGSTTATACGCRGRRRARRGSPPQSSVAVAVAVPPAPAATAPRPVARRRHSVVVGAARRQPDQPALGVLGVLAVPQVVARLDLRDLGEVVLGRRRRDRPLERAAVPRVVDRDAAPRLACVYDHVHEEDRAPTSAMTNDADRLDVVQRCPSPCPAR